MSNPIVRSIGILLARIAVGVVFLAHGLQKFQQNGWGGPKGFFEMIDVPLPAVSAFLVTWLEILGGIALIVGVLTPVVGLLFVLDMVGAIFFAHIDNGLWASDGGYEFVLTLGAASLLLTVVGAGLFSVDAVVGRKIGWLAPDSATRRDTAGVAG
ncbi:DoxX family protein [Gordonia aurantiaca]|uniref:DoxX family protein n=1 Tax=Gordonia sp. B21 TaxID=3151852 RepID=UPI00326336DC